MQLTQVTAYSQSAQSTISRVFVHSAALLCVIYQPSPSKLVKTRHIWRHDLQTESTGSRRSEMIGDSCSRCERVDNSTSSWVDLCRYKRPLRRMKILATRHWLQWQSWMAACPRCLCLHSADEDAVSWLTNYSPHDIVVANIHTYTK